MDGLLWGEAKYRSLPARMMDDTEFQLTAEVAEEHEARDGNQN